MAHAFLLWLQPLEGAARRLDLGISIRQACSGLMPVLATMAVLLLRVANPIARLELYYLPSLTANPKRLTNFNGQVTALSLGKVEKIEWTNDEFTMDGVLTYPPDFAAGRTYPLVLRLFHGGPNSASKESFGTLPQQLAARGWLVF